RLGAHRGHGRLTGGPARSRAGDRAMSAAQGTLAPPAPSTAAPATEALRWPSARTWADIAVMLVLAVLGVIGFEPSFGGYGFLAAGIGGLVLGSATGILSSVFRLGAITTA